MWEWGPREDSSRACVRAGVLVASAVPPRASRDPPCAVSRAGPRPGPLYTAAGPVLCVSQRGVDRSSGGSS
jgi:hypothetical protein